MPAASDSADKPPDGDSGCDMTGAVVTDSANSGDASADNAKLAEEEEKDEDEDDEEEEEEEDVDKIVERSRNERWAKRNIRLPRHAPGVSGSYLAIDQRVGKDVVWNEIVLTPDKANEAISHRFNAVMKRLSRKHHPNMIRYLDYWTQELEGVGVKLVFITERTEEGTLKQFMSNTNRSRTIWQRCMANLLSVLKFFLEIGLTHGNLTSETIHYQQKSGNLKIGTIAIDDVLNPKANRDRSKFVTVKHYLAPEYADAASKITPAVDIYALGVIALELAAWERKDDLIFSSQERLDAMMKRLQSEGARDFIRGCLHSDPQLRHNWRSLYRHCAVFVVPKLDVLAARCFVAHAPPSLDQKTMHDLLDQLMDRFELDTVVLQMTRAGIDRAKLFKDLICHTLNCKFLEDVKNGFHLVFGFGDRDEVHPADLKSLAKRIKDPQKLEEPGSREPNEPDKAARMPAEVKLPLPAAESVEATVPKEPHLAIVATADAVAHADVDNAELEAARPDNVHEGEYASTDETKEDEDEDEEDGEFSLLNRKELERLHGPPEQDKQESLQFLDIELYYIGLGRWNLHLKVWFEERHIMRDVNMQLTEQNYRQPRRIARQFVEDKICGQQDEKALARRVAFACLGHPTVNGRIEEYSELCSKLGCAETQEAESADSPTSVSPSALRSHRLDPRLLLHKLEAVSREEERRQLRDCDRCALVPVEMPPSLLFWGCGPACRSYRECRWHDKCDYLSRADLPEYLTARCYHCREQLAKEAGVDAFTLWWMHSQHRVPYPYFLQARMGYPLDPVTPTHVAYDCRFRSRKPCRCLRDRRSGRVLELPPCTEFPEDYEDEEERRQQQASTVTSKCWINEYVHERGRRLRRCSGNDWRLNCEHRKRTSC